MAVSAFGGIAGRVSEGREGPFQAGRGRPAPGRPGRVGSAIGRSQPSPITAHCFAPLPRRLVRPVSRQGCAPGWRGARCAPVNRCELLTPAIPLAFVASDWCPAAALRRRPSASWVCSTASRPASHGSPSAPRPKPLEKRRRQVRFAPISLTSVHYSDHSRTPLGAAPRGRAARLSAATRLAGPPAGDRRPLASLSPPPCRSEACPAAPRQPGIVGLADRLRRVDDLLAGGQLHLHVVQLGPQHVGARAVGLPPPLRLIGPLALSVPARLGSLLVLLGPHSACIGALRRLQRGISCSCIAVRRSRRSSARWRSSARSTSARSALAFAASNCSRSAVTASSSAARAPAARRAMPPSTDGLTDAVSSSLGSGLTDGLSSATSGTRINTLP